MKLCFLIPYYNHPLKIACVIEKLKSYQKPIILVDDGSDRESKKALEGLEYKGLEIVTREKNGGKGAAILEGFRVAIQKGYSHCFQIDADMQHDLEKIPDFLSLVQKNPNTLVCGAPLYGDDAPKSRLYGRKITDFWVWVNTLGGDLKDVMCGMRIYPMDEVKKILHQIKTQRMDFDIDILLLLYKNGAIIHWIDVKVQYQDDGVSHFRGLKDNLMISKIHARHFFALPKYLFKQIKKRFFEQKQWHLREEKAGYFWIRLSLLCVMYLPNFLLRILLFCIVGFFYIFSFQERRNIKEFREQVGKYFGSSVLRDSNVFSHFYQFAQSICDKFNVWKGRVNLDCINFADKEALYRALCESGKVILVSHFGNIEILRSLSQEIKGVRINILVHSKNALAFNRIVNELSKSKAEVFEVSQLDVAMMLELQKRVQRGEHLGIMGDRVALDSTKNLPLSFLGRKCYFPSGAFVLASLLECPMMMIWCEKRKERFFVDSQEIAKRIVLTKPRTESLEQYMQIYVDALEKKVRDNPAQWFNFFDFFKNLDEVR